MKNVQQAGANYLVNSNRNVTRYDHSVGVMLLLRCLNCSIEEQLSGLLHDISHTAFSHTIDMLVNNIDENYHEIVKNEVVDYFKLSSYFTKSEYDMKKILEPDHFPLLDQPQPNLCADRIDYTLRDLKTLGLISQTEIDKFLSSLIVNGNNLIVTDTNIAIWFCEKFHYLVKNIFMDPTENYYSYKFTQILNVAIEEKVINMKHLLLGNDRTVMKKLKESKNPKIENMLADFFDKQKVVCDSENYEIVVKPKARTVDPLVLKDGKIVRLSSISDIVKNLYNNILAISNDGLFLRSNKNFI